MLLFSKWMDRSGKRTSSQPAARLVRLAAVLFLLTLALSACNFTGGVEPVASPTAAVLEASPTSGQAPSPVPASPTALPASPTAAPSATPAPTATPTTAPTATPQENVAGQICYPGGSAPGMTLYFQKAGAAEETIELPLPPGQSSYATRLPAGEWIAYAWLADFTRGGLYSDAVGCSGESCSDHDPRRFQVQEGAAVQGIDICDWFAPFTVPSPPGVDPNELTGDISGRILYPGGSPPDLKIVAFNRGTGAWQYYLFKAGTTSYTLSNLTPGVYVIVAYDEDGNAGGHAGAGHALLEVSVKPGQTTSGVDINDWSAPDEAFPPDPSK